METQPTQRVSWKVHVVVGFVALVVTLSFLIGGHDELINPCIASAFALGTVIYASKAPRKHTWFWIFLIVMAILHVVAILAVPWTKKQIPAILSYPFALADIGIMQFIVKRLSRWSGEAFPQEGGDELA